MPFADFGALADFLVEAKKATYASGKKGTKKGDGSESYVYFDQESGFLYEDRFFGDRLLIGQEIVWHNDKPIWGMNYYGMINQPALDELWNQNFSIDSESIAAFLRQALSKVEPKYPYRGPRVVSSGNYFYKLEFNRDYDNSELKLLVGFVGNEVIEFTNIPVWFLDFSGGLIASYA